MWGIESVDHPAHLAQLDSKPRVDERPVVRLQASAVVSQLVWCVDCERHVSLKGHAASHLLLGV